jgi:hypothetical protein
VYEPVPETEVVHVYVPGVVENCVGPLIVTLDTVNCGEADGASTETGVGWSAQAARARTARMQQLRVNDLYMGFLEVRGR